MHSYCMSCLPLDVYLREQCEYINFVLHGYFIGRIYSKKIFLLKIKCFRLFLGRDKVMSTMCHYIY